MYQGEINGKVRGTGIEDRISTGLLSPEQVQGLFGLLANCPPGKFKNRCNAVYDILKDYGVNIPSEVFERLEDEHSLKSTEPEKDSKIVRAIRKAFGIKV